MTEFAIWYEAQFGPRSLDRYSDGELEREARAGRMATQELVKRRAWDERRTAALYAWTAAKKAAVTETQKEGK